MQAGAAACIDCAAPISHKSRGRCRPCAARATAARPEHAAKISEALRRRYASDPAFRARLSAHLRSVAEPGETKAARAREQRLWERGHAARWASAPPGSAARAEAGRRISAGKLAHIPADVRAEYRHLVRRGFAAAEAERIVRAHQATDLARFRRDIGR